MRLFFGIQAGCTAYLMDLQRQLKAIGRGRMTDADNLHLTLKFLGEVPYAQLETLREAMNEVRAAQFHLVCHGAEVFNRSGIVSAKVGGELDKLSALHTLLESALEERGFARDTRPYRPHITLARGFELKGDIASVSGDTCGFDVGRIILYESRRENGRLVYAPIFVRELHG